MSNPDIYLGERATKCTYAIRCIAFSGSEFEKIFVSALKELIGQVTVRNNYFPEHLDPIFEPKIKMHLNLGNKS